MFWMCIRIASNVANLIHIHNIGFYGEISKFFTFYHFDFDPRFPPSYYMLGGNLGSLLYRDVSVMIIREINKTILRCTGFLPYTLNNVIVSYTCVLSAKQARGKT